MSHFSFKNIIVLDYWQDIPKLVFKALFAKLRPHFLDFAGRWSLPDLADSKRIDTSGHDELPLVLSVCFFHWIHTLDTMGVVEKFEGQGENLSFIHLRFPQFSQRVAYKSRVMKLIKLWLTNKTGSFWQQMVCTSYMDFTCRWSTTLPTFTRSGSSERWFRIREFWGIPLWWKFVQVGELILLAGIGAKSLVQQMQ